MPAGNFLHAFIDRLVPITPGKPAACAVGLAAALLWILPAHAVRIDSCPMAREMAIKGVEMFEAEPSKGLSALERAYKLCPDDLAVGYNLGLAYYHSNKKPEAKRVWTKVHERHENHVNTDANLAWVSFELGDDENAHILAFKGLERHGGHLALAHTKLYALFRLGRYPEAYDWLTRAGLAGIKAKRWRSESVEYVIETLWRQYREGEKKDAVARAVMLLKDYPDEDRLIQAKDQLVRAFVDENAEIPYPLPLPHETWTSEQGLLTGRETLDDGLAALPTLNQWEKRQDAYALIIGIQRYRFHRARYFADRDAENLKQLLVSRGLFVDDADHIRLRQNATSTFDSLGQDIQWLVTQGEINANAMLLLYFSGHGEAVTDGEGKVVDLLLAPTDTPAQGLSRQNGISLLQTMKSLERLPNQEVVVLIDSCFNGGKGCGLKGEGTPIVLDPALFKAKKPLAVAAVNQEAALYGPGRQGSFTFYLMKGMLDLADGASGSLPDGWVDLVEAFSYAKEKLGQGQDPALSMAEPIRLSRGGGDR